MKKIIYTLLAVLCLSQAQGQTSLFGKVTAKETGESIIGANVVLKKNGVFETGADTDFEGNYSVINIDPGAYDVEVSYVGFRTMLITGVLVPEGKSTRLDVGMESGGVELATVIITGYKVPMIDHDNTSSGGFVTAEQIQRVPTKNINAIVANVAGASSADEGDGMAIKGSRSNSPRSTVTPPTPPRSTVPPPPPPPPPHPEKGKAGDEYGALTENDHTSPEDTPYSTFSIDVDRASYSLFRKHLSNGSLPPPDAVRTEEFINYFTYDYPQPSGQHPFSVHSELSDCPWQKGNWLLSIGLQGENRNLAQMPPSHLVFLVDVSGSMNQPNKLPLVKKSLSMLADQLRPRDQVAIVVYAGAAGLVLPMTPGSEKESIKAAIEKLQAGGSTAGGAGILLAYQLAQNNYLERGNNRVILATDGDFNVGVNHPDSLETLIARKRETGVFLTTLGYGMGNLKDNRLERLADKGNGQYAYIDTEAEARKVFTSELTGTLYSIAKDVKLQLRFNPAVVATYRLVGYENRLLAKEDFDDDTKDAGELGAGHCVTALYEIQPLPGAMMALDSLATLELRYKKPDGEQSYLMQEPLTHRLLPLENTSNDFRWAAAVAETTLIMKNSPYRGEASLEQVRQLAAGAKGPDPFGFRGEFISLLGQLTTLIANR